MSHENDRKRTRGHDGAGAKAASLADLESMLRQALVRMDSLEKKNAAVMCETKALREDVEGLKEENRALKWSLSKLAGHVQRNWQYPESHAIQPDEYWRDKGFDDEEIPELQQHIMGGFVSAVSDLAHGVCDNITIGDCHSHDMVLHDAALEPHWIALTESLRMHRNPHGTGMEVIFQNIQLNKDILRLVYRRLSYHNIRDVGLYRIQFTDIRHAILALKKMLENSNVKSLAWSEIPIESVDDMALFTQMLSDQQNLEDLRFDHNGNENTQALLAGVDLSKFKRLDLHVNNLRTNGRADIPNLIASNSTLERLELDSNQLNDDDAVLIAESLGHNTHLKRLMLGDNNIHARGMRALRRAVNDTSSMNALSDSNHSCCVIGINPNACRKINRILKIHILMTERYRSGEGNVTHLNREVSGENSVLLAPFIIESIHRRKTVIEEMPFTDRWRVCKTPKAPLVLGLLYELVKDWKMPGLFSFR